MKSILEIEESFRSDMRMFELYNEDIQKSIEKIKEQVREFQDYMASGGSIAVEPRVQLNKEGKQLITAGIDDNPYTREVLKFALENRITQTREYVNISLLMALSYLISIFDAKYLDVYLCYIQGTARHPESQKTPEERVMDFSYKSFSKQLESWKQHTKIDFNKILGKSIILEVIELRETRNLYVHNNGIVNEKYINTVPATDLKIGAKRPLSIEYFERAKEVIEVFFYKFAAEFSDKISKR